MVVDRHVKHLCSLLIILSAFTIFQLNSYLTDSKLITAEQKYQPQCEKCGPNDSIDGWMNDLSGTHALKSYTKKIESLFLA